MHRAIWIEANVLLPLVAEHLEHHRGRRRQAHEGITADDFDIGHALAFDEYHLRPVVGRGRRIGGGGRRER